MKSVYKLKNGEIALSFKLNIKATKHIMAKALCEHFFDKNQPFPKKLSKKLAEQIIKNRLYFYGIEGEYYNGAEFTINQDEIQIYEDLLKEANNFINAKYPEFNLI